MRLYLLVPFLISTFLAGAQTTTTYTTATTWTVPTRVNSISVTVYGGGGGSGGQDCGAGCTNAAGGNAGYVVASFAVSPGNVVGLYPGGVGSLGASAAAGTGGGNGGVASYGVAYNGGRGGHAGSTGTSGAGGGGGGATVVTIGGVIKVVAGGAGGGGGMANQALSGQAGTTTYSANGTSNTGGIGTMPAGDGGGGGGGGGGSFGSLGGGTHAAGSEQAGNGGNIGGNLVSGASTTTSNTNVIWTSGGRIDVTYTVLLPVTWIGFTAAPQINGSVLLNWSTSSEINSHSFVVERSANGSTWTRVGEVAAAGNSTGVSAYQFSDQPPSSNNWYYRLAQIDLDGKITYSKIILASVSGSRIVKIYPNPVTAGVATISLPDAGVVAIYDSNGKALMRRQLAAGENKIDCSSYAPGIYFVVAGDQKIKLVVK